MTPETEMFCDYDSLSDRAKDAWQRGFNIAPFIAGMDGLAINVVYDEAIKLDDPEAEQAMAMGFMSGMMAKAGR